jgi:uncharacterized protein involved in high-affinity Fe2+ transport
MEHMKSKTLTVRLRPEELAILDKLRNGYNRGEYLRYLVISEHQRRHGQGRARPNQFMSDMRNGRPTENCNTLPKQ